MTNSNKNNLVSFLRHNQPPIPHAHPDLEQKLISSLEPQSKSQKLRFKSIWTLPKAIVIGFFFTSMSFSLKTPRIALEPQDLENFLVKNWQNTLDNDGYSETEITEAYWLLPTVSDSQPTLSVSAH